MKCLGLRLSSVRRQADQEIKRSAVIGALSPRTPKGSTATPKYFRSGVEEGKQSVDALTSTLPNKYLRSRLIPAQRREDQDIEGPARGPRVMSTSLSPRPVSVLHATGIDNEGACHLSLAYPLPKHA